MHSHLRAAKSPEIERPGHRTPLRLCPAYRALPATAPAGCDEIELCRGPVRDDCRGPTGKTLGDGVAIALVQGFVPRLGVNPCRDVGKAHPLQTSGKIEH